MFVLKLADQSGGRIWSAGKSTVRWDTNWRSYIIAFDIPKKLEEHGALHRTTPWVRSARKNFAQNRRSLVVVHLKSPFSYPSVLRSTEERQWNFRSIFVHIIKAPSERRPRSANSCPGRCHWVLQKCWRLQLRTMRTKGVASGLTPWKIYEHL